MKPVSATLHENLPLIEVAEPALLDDLYGDERAAQYLLARISERVAVVAPGQFEALRARLRKLGHLPKMLE